MGTRSGKVPNFFYFVLIIPHPAMIPDLVPCLLQVMANTKKGESC